ncbi:MAG: riboflavin synthase [Flavobacteriales bacterium]|nr:riboflavin synthase [Flavobacteriales bacterium]
MFTGIIECLGTISDIHPYKDNIKFSIMAPFLSEIKVDQSISHDGVCLTVEEIKVDHYVVSAVPETLKKTNLADRKVRDKVNLERSMRIGGRLDGHIVQGHVDHVAACTGIEELKGSWVFDFEYGEGKDALIVEKGSITVNGTSLTAINTKKGGFSVAIIPYTFEHTNFQDMRFGSKVNLEYDVIGKYVEKLIENRL